MEDGGLDVRNHLRQRLQMETVENPVNFCNNLLTHQFPRELALKFDRSFSTIFGSFLLEGLKLSYFWIQGGKS